MHVCVCHITVKRTFWIILDARKASAQRRYNEPKIIENASRSSELWAGEEHHVELILKKWIMRDFTDLQ